MARRPNTPRQQEPAPLIDVCGRGRPVSAQTRNRAALRHWQNRVRVECLALWGHKAPILEDVGIRVTHYCESNIGDVDNLTKPIQDALQGFVYADDRQVSDIVANRRNIGGAFVVRIIPMQVLAAFSDGREFVHIRVWRSPKRENLG